MFFRSRLNGRGRVSLADFVDNRQHPLGGAPVEFRDDLLGVLVELSPRRFGAGPGGRGGKGDRCYALETKNVPVPSYYEWAFPTLSQATFRLSRGSVRRNLNIGRAACTVA